MKHDKFKSLAISIVSIFIIILLFIISYTMDNKYTRPNVRGSNGELTISNDDLKSPLFLIDGWLLSVNDNVSSETFIGQYSNFSYAPNGTSPFGKGTYKLNIHFTDEPRILTMEIPEIFTDYVLNINGQTYAQSDTGSLVSFIVSDDTEIELITFNNTHYYSGLYYPPVLGDTHMVEKIHVVKIMLYAIVCISSLMLFIFSFLLWIWREKNALFFHFGLLCLAAFFNCIHPFVWQLGINNCIWYALEDMGRIWVCVEAIAIASIVSEVWNDTKNHYILYPVSIGIIIFMGISVTLIIPHCALFIPIYGVIMNILIVTCWVILSIITGIGLGKKQNTFSTLLLISCSVEGFSVFDKLLDNNHFEPIYTLWQEEWATFILVIIFAYMALSYNAKLLKENRLMKNNLEEMVENRTMQLQSVIEERKRFFSDMAHNLKAPIATIHGFISLIQKQNVGIDDELLGYIAIIENENIEMQKRVQSLNILNDYDRITEPKERINIDEILAEVEDCNKPDADVLGISLQVGRLNKTQYIFAQHEKLLILFENLIYNAFSFTPQNGAITILAESDSNNVIITVKDNGTGISEEKIPYIFDRFYVGRENKSEGSGLGLYIVKLTVEEIGGSISVKSQEDVGTAFKIVLPLMGSYNQDLTES